MCKKVPLRKINNFSKVEESVSGRAKLSSGENQVYIRQERGRKLLRRGYYLGIGAFDDELTGMKGKIEEVTKETVPKNARDERHGKN